MVVKDKIDFEISEFYRSRTFEKVEILMIFSKNHFFRKLSRLRRESEKKRRKEERGGSPALRVIRAETRLTVYRWLPYQNNRKKKEQGAPHADALDHGKHVFKCNCLVKCAC